MGQEAVVPGIDPRELYELSCRQAVDLIDVSTPVEFEEVRAPFSHNAPIGSAELEATLQRRHGAARPLYVMCRGGVRSVKVCRQHPDLGLVNVEGGTRRWTELALPTARDASVLSLERQASLAAGALLLVSGALGLVVAPAALVAAVAVGSLLTVAGATDLRALEIALSKMPWNTALRSRARPAR